MLAGLRKWQDRTYITIKISTIFGRKLRTCPFDNIANGQTGGNELDVGGGRSEI